MKIRNLMAAILAAACVASFTACSSNNSGNSSADIYSLSEIAGSADLSAADMVNNAPASGGNVGDVEIQSGDIYAEFEIEGFGAIRAKLFPDIAPVGVQNFIQLAQDGFYTGKSIHRVIDGFMFQGGSLNGDGTGGNAAYTGTDDGATSFGIEVSDQARHFYGALCYANAAGQNTTQFYIVNSKSVDDPADYDKAIAELTAERDKYEAGSEGYEYYNYYIESYTKTAEKLRSLSDKYKEQGGTPSLDDDYTVFGQVVEGFDVIDNISAVEVTTGSSGENSQPVQDIIIKSVKVYTAD